MNVESLINVWLLKYNKHSCVKIWDSENRKFIHTLLSGAEIPDEIGKLEVKQFNQFFSDEEKMTILCIHI